MSTRVTLFHDWLAQVGALLPEARVTRSRTLARLVFGMVRSGSVTLLKVAAATPAGVNQASTEHQFRRWLANAQVKVTDLWPALLPSLVASQRGRELKLVLDPTPQNATASIVMIGLICRQRTLPLAWRVMPAAQTWPQSLVEIVRELVAEIVPAIPQGCRVRLIGDRGLTSAELIDVCREVGWWALFRLSAQERQGCTVRLADGHSSPVWDLVTKPGQRWNGAVELFKGAGWRTVELTIRWDVGQAEPWILLSDRAAGFARVREYRQRMSVEATYADCKRRGWDIEASKVTALERLDRLLLGLHLAYWWSTQLGLRAIRRGERARFDRHDRRDLSVVRIGRAWLEDRLDEPKRRPPLPFRATATGFQFTWLA
jgi:hypothetical protein